MKGKFTGKSVELYIILTPKSKIVRAVSVYFNKKNNWSSIKSDYFDLKKSLAEKYAFDSEYEFFEDPYYEGDGYEMQAVELEKCTYATFFTSDYGSILLEISKFCQLEVTYEDVINTQKASVEKESQVMEDL